MISGFFRSLDLSRDYFGYLNLGKVIFAKICLLWGRGGAKTTSFHSRSLFIVISFCFDLVFFAARISFLPCAFVATATSHCSPSTESLSWNVLTCNNFVFVNVHWLSYSRLPTPTHHYHHHHHHHLLKKCFIACKKRYSYQGRSQLLDYLKAWLTFITTCPEDCTHD